MREEFVGGGGGCRKKTLIQLLRDAQSLRGSCFRANSRPLRTSHGSSAGAGSSAAVASAGTGASPPFLTAPRFPRGRSPDTTTLSSSPGIPKLKSRPPSRRRCARRRAETTPPGLAEAHLGEERTRRQKPTVPSIAESWHEVPERRQGNNATGDDV